jgi:hypothetical protein
MRGLIRLFRPSHVMESGEPSETRSVFILSYDKSILPLAINKCASRFCVYLEKKNSMNFIGKVIAFTTLL